MMLTQLHGSWAAVLASVLMLGGYELRLWRIAQRDPAATARSSHRELRNLWVRALSEQQGSELLAVQALRNSLMSATINASTAALALMGSISLMMSHEANVTWELSPGLVLRWLLSATLFAAYVCSAFSMRYYHHAGFAMSLRVGSTLREHYTELAAGYVGSAGVLYSWSLRCFLFLAPIVAGLLSPLIMPLLTLALLFVLTHFDRQPRLSAATLTARAQPASASAWRAQADDSTRTDVAPKR